MWLWLTGAALAACPERVSPGELERRVRSLAEPIVYLEAGAREDVARLEALLDGCVTGPLSPEQISRLWITVGVAEAMSDEGLSEEGRLRFGAAFAITGAEGWIPEFGAELEREYLRSAALVLGSADVRLSFPDSEIVAVDGQVLYARGVQELAPGLHVVQWTEGGAWTGRVLRLEEDAMASLGDAPEVEAAATPEPDPTPERSAAVELTLGLGGYGSGAAPMAYLATADGAEVLEVPFKPLVPLDVWAGVRLGGGWQLGVVAGVTPVLRGRVLYSTPEVPVAAARGYVQGALFCARVTRWGQLGATGGVAMPGRLTTRVYAGVPVGDWPLWPELRLGVNLATPQAEQPEDALGRWEVGLELAVRRRVVGS